ncbi:hypothetical protein [Pseudomonas oryzihabitans]|uniref:hypothetical protein n=1 Tax=Pseudomonas oryzihabitans TaxID=47885 RepID=UPI0021D7FC6D|nr:hypothetical protein [Pseudomonas oryzihabitans]
MYHISVFPKAGDEGVVYWKWRRFKDQERPVWSVESFDSEESCMDAAISDAAGNHHNFKIDDYAKYRHNLSSREYALWYKLGDSRNGLLSILINIEEREKVTVTESGNIFFPYKWRDEYLLPEELSVEVWESDERVWKKLIGNWGFIKE